MSTVLRGLCILSVILHHVIFDLRWVKYPVKASFRDAGTAFCSGPACTPYRVLCDFRISHHRFVDPAMGRSWGVCTPAAFYRQRMARIPSLLLLRPGGAKRFALSGPFRRARCIRGGRVSDKALFAALTFRMNWLEGSVELSAPAWGFCGSLSIEEVFYIAFPLVCLFLRSERFFHGRCCSSSSPVRSIG
jgi:peptidoglycan/LPS O-acetylase OafA/YrhL